MRRNHPRCDTAATVVTRPTGHRRKSAAARRLGPGPGPPAGPAAPGPAAPPPRGRSGGRPLRRAATRLPPSAARDGPHGGRGPVIVADIRDRESVRTMRIAGWGVSQRVRTPSPVESCPTRNLCGSESMGKPARDSLWGRSQQFVAWGGHPRCAPGPPSPPAAPPSPRSAPSRRPPPGPGRTNQRWEKRGPIFPPFITPACRVAPARPPPFPPILVRRPPESTPCVPLGRPPGFRASAARAASPRARRSPCIWSPASCRDSCRRVTSRLRDSALTSAAAFSRCSPSSSADRSAAGRGLRPVGDGPKGGLGGGPLGSFGTQGGSVCDFRLATPVFKGPRPLPSPPLPSAGSPAQRRPRDGCNRRLAKGGEISRMQKRKTK